ncbi:MAG: hypothetical protein EA398_04435 [Deltaproteobacteria bacterium]|nr:MAG: hypothetical protein EA398_04435 [Deltaproteobacteria bacterium]
MRSLITALILLMALPAAASASSLSGVLGGLSWGDSPEQLLAQQRQRLMDEYRQRISDVDDPLEIDRIRRGYDERLEGIANSHEEFTSPQTGYEVSVLAGEIRGAAGYSLITVRGRGVEEYYVFRNGALVKLIQSFDVIQLDYIGFDPFVDELVDALGSPADVEDTRDDIGRRTTLRAVWNDGTTRLRVENRARMYNAYLLVFGDASVEDEFVRQEEVTGPAARRSTRGAGAIMQRINSEERQDYGDPSVVDQIIGTTPGDVRTMLRADEREAAERAEREARERESAMDDEDELEEGERRARPRRTTPRPETREEETFY